MDRAARAIAAVQARALADRDSAVERLIAGFGAEEAERVLTLERLFPGRTTINFHPDRIAAGGVTVAEGLLDTGRYRSQWATWISGGGRMATDGGPRQQWESDLFAGAYDGADPGVDEYPVYGAYDFFHADHGGSPRFGSCFLVLADHVADRTTLCIGDSHLGPRDVGTHFHALSLAASFADEAGGNVGRPWLGTSFRTTTSIRDLDALIEAQIHGGVSLADDVDAIVADPSFRTSAIGGLLGRVAERYGCRLWYHQGSTLRVDRVPDDFRGPTMPALARRVAAGQPRIDAKAIGRAAALIEPTPPTVAGDADDSDFQQLKYLWHTLFVHGSDAEFVPS